MKKCISLLLAAILLISLDGKSANRVDEKGNPVLDFIIEKSYILLPVEEAAPAIRMHVNFHNNEFQPTYYICLARQKVDYWVKLDVDKYTGKTISITFEGLTDADSILNRIEQSDNFEFDYDETYRPSYHFTPIYGWMNDPNGMVYMNGEYHLFYQYNPYGAKWGNMHWGHAVSTDLMNWKYLPEAIGMDSLGDIFSGSAVIDRNNTAGFGKNAMVAIYTSNGKTQQQSIAYSNDGGYTFEKYAGNPVIANPGIIDFRDPKVSWNEQSKQWIMALATGQTITFYGSADLKHWNRLSEFGKGVGAHSEVWECPDFFPLKYKGKTKWVLLTSNNGGPNGGSATQYFIGNFDGKQFTADPLPYPLWVDYGKDNYAGVTWSDIPANDGRRLFLGWMSNWQYANDVPTTHFRSAMTVPRELTLGTNGKHLILKNNPVAELVGIRGTLHKTEEIRVQNLVALVGCFSDYDGAYELEMTIRPQKSSHFGFKLSNGLGEYLEYRFDLTTNTLTVDRSKSGRIDFSRQFVSEIKAPIVPKAVYKVRLLVDKASAELFVNNGETVTSNLFFPTEPMNSLYLFATDGTVVVRNIRSGSLKN